MLCEYVEEAPAEEEVGLVSCESDVTLVELETYLQCGWRHNGGHVEDIYWDVLHRNALGSIMLVAMDVVANNERMWRGQTLFVSSYLFIYIWGGGDDGMWLCRGRCNP